MFQHESFVYDALDGCTLEQLRGPADAAIFFLKPSGRPWQRFFLDAGLTFWAEIDEPDEPLDVDYAARFAITGAHIGRIAADPTPRLRITLSLGHLILEAPHLTFEPLRL